MIKITWRTKLIALFTLILSASLLIQVFYVIPFIQDREVREVEIHQTEIARNIGRELNISLNRLTDSLILIAEHNVIRNMEISNQTEILFQYISLPSEISNLWVLNRTGWFVSGTQENMSGLYTQSYDFAPFFIIPFEQGEIYLAPPISYYNNTLIVSSVGVPIESGTGERVGVLLGTIILNDLIKRISDYPLREGQVLYIVVANGIVVAHSEIDLFNLEEGALSLNYSSHYLVKEIMIGGKSGSHEYIINGTSYIGANIVIESSGWGIIVETPKNKIQFDSRVLVQNMLLFNIVIFIIAAVVTLVFTQQITSDQIRMEKMNREFEQRRENFVWMTSHELRTPLTVIIGYFDFLQKNLAQIDHDRQEKIFSTIHSNLSRLERLIDEVSSIAQFERGIFTIEKTTFNFSKFFQEAKEEYKTLLGEQLEILEFQLEFPLNIEGDQNRLRQVLDNLVSNAIHHSHPENRLIKLSLTISSSIFQITITDNGAGIAPDNLERIFTQFVSIETEFSTAGTGIGLYLSKKIMEAHGGKVTAQSQGLGHGSTFIVELPR